jgi:hypothetical protein
MIMYWPCLFYITHILLGISRKEWVDHVNEQKVEGVDGEMGNETSAPAAEHGGSRWLEDHTS